MTLFEYRAVLINGAMTTLEISGLALVLGVCLGGVVAAMARTKWLPFRIIAATFIELPRSIPPLILFFGCYYGLGYAWSVQWTPFETATVVLTLTSGAMMAEVFRGGLEGVSRGQWLAAEAAGFSRFMTYRHIILPQAVRHSIPPAIGVYVATLKDSSMASVIGFVELTKAGLMVRENTGSSFQVFFAVAALYFVMNFSISNIGRYLGRRLKHA